MSETASATPDRVIDAARLRELEERGFAVLSAFLSPSELDLVRADYRTVSRAHPASVSGLPSRIRFDDRAPVGARFDALLAALRRHTALRADLPTQGSYVVTRGIEVTKPGTVAELHSDTPAEYFSQGVESCIKVWVPIHKPDPARTGMYLLRMDELRRREPAIHARIVDRAGVAAVDRHTLRLQCGTTLSLGRPIDELLDAPVVAEGDAVVFSAHTMHKTQDFETDRTAWTVQIAWGGKLLRRDRLYYWDGRRRTTQRWWAVLQHASFLYFRRDSVTYAEHRLFRQRLGEREPRALWAAGRAYLLAPLVSRWDGWRYQR
jgi:hypothetical protein